MQPEPPSNVQLKHSDGRAVPLDCVYKGERDGTHYWTVTMAVPFEEDMIITMDVLPAKTCVQTVFIMEQNGG